MKAFKTLITIFTFLLLHKQAEAFDSLSRAYFHEAKVKLEAMLNGQAPLSYEEAIYTIENAWWEGRIDHASYQKVLDHHIQNIKGIIAANRDSTRLNPKSTWLKTKEELVAQYEQALANYAIYQYMTNAMVFFRDNDTTVHFPFTYSTTDPMGTRDWGYTHVTNVLNSNKGNCFALASLYKIFSERLSSNATLTTAPGHIYIRHGDDKGVRYNLELSNGMFPGDGTISTITYTPKAAIQNGIALRELNAKRSVALCLVYLAKGYEYKFGIKDDDFMLSCAEAALSYDSLNLNAMLLKAEVLETRLIAQQKDAKALHSQNDFKAYEQWITHIYDLGYREMPYEMKNIILKGWQKDSLGTFSTTNHKPQRIKHPYLTDTRYASVSWGKFDEEIRTKPLERFGNTVFDTRTKKIVSFMPDDVLYDNYNFDPAAFAWNVDPLAHKFPHQSPYSAMDNSPIWKNDPTGKSGEIVIDKQARTATVYMNIYLYGSKANSNLAISTAKDIANLYNAANATVNVGNQTYKVQFVVKGEYLGSGFFLGLEADIAQTIYNNTDIRNNYYRVEARGIGAGGVSSASLLGNDGVFKYSEISGDGSTTEGHELGHGLGLVHNFESAWQSTIPGKPDLMDTRGDKVIPKYQMGYALPDGTLDINKREVSQKNIDDIFTNEVVNQLQKNGRATIGTTTNSYYNRNGQESKKP